MGPTRNKYKKFREFSVSVSLMTYLVVMGFVLLCLPSSSDNIFTSASPLPLSNLFSATRDAKEELKTVGLGVGRKVKTTFQNFFTRTHQTNENGGNVSNSVVNNINFPSQLTPGLFPDTSSSQRITHSSGSESSHVGFIRPEPEGSHHGDFQQSSSGGWSHSISSPVIFEEDSDASITFSKTERGGTKTGSTKTGQTSSKTVNRQSSSKTSSSGSGWVNGGSASGSGIGIQQFLIIQSNTKLNSSERQNMSETNQHVGQDSQNHYSEAALEMFYQNGNNTTPSSSRRDEEGEFETIDVFTQSKTSDNDTSMKYAYSNQTSHSNIEQSTESKNNVVSQNLEAHSEIKQEVSSQFDLNQDVEQNQNSGSYVLVAQSFNLFETTLFPSLKEDPEVQDMSKSKDFQNETVQQNQLSQILEGSKITTTSPLIAEPVIANSNNNAKHVYEISESESQFSNESKVSVDGFVEQFENQEQQNSHKTLEQFENQEQQQNSHEIVEQFSQSSSQSEEHLGDTMTSPSKDVEFVKENDLSKIVLPIVTFTTIGQEPSTLATTTTTASLTSQPYELTLNESKNNRSSKLRLSEKINFKGAHKVLPPKNNENPTGGIQKESQLNSASVVTNRTGQLYVQQRNVELVASGNVSGRIPESQAFWNKAEEFVANRKDNLPDSSKHISNHKVSDQGSSKQKMNESLSVNHNLKTEQKSSKLISAEFTTPRQNTVELQISSNDFSELIVNVDDVNFTDNSSDNHTIITAVPTPNCKFSKAECLDSSKDLRKLWFWILFCCGLCLVIIFLLIFIWFFVLKLLKHRLHLVENVQSKDEYQRKSIIQIGCVGSDKKTSVNMANLNCQKSNESSAATDIKKCMVVKSSESHTNSDKQIGDNNLWNIDKALLYNSSEGTRSNSSGSDEDKSYRDFKETRHPSLSYRTHEQVKKLPSESQANSAENVQVQVCDSIAVDQDIISIQPPSKPTSTSTVKTPVEMLSLVSLAQITGGNKLAAKGQSLTVPPPSPTEKVSGFQNCAANEIKTITTTTVTVEHQQSEEKNSTKHPMSQKSEKNITSRVKENINLKKTDKKKLEFLNVSQQNSASLPNESIQLSFRDIYNRMEKRKEMEKNRQSSGTSTICAKCHELNRISFIQ